MKKIKKFISLIIVILMLLSISGCHVNEEDVKNNTLPNNNVINAAPKYYNVGLVNVKSITEQTNMNCKLLNVITEECFDSGVRTVINTYTYDNNNDKDISQDIEKYAEYLMSKDGKMMTILNEDDTCVNIEFMDSSCICIKYSSKQIEIIVTSIEY